MKYSRQWVLLKVLKLDLTRSIITYRKITTTTEWIGPGFIIDVRHTMKCGRGTAVASILNERTGGAASGSFTIRMIGIVSVAGEWRARRFTPVGRRGGMKWRCGKLRCLCHPHQGAGLWWAIAIPCSASRGGGCIRWKEKFSLACICSFWIEPSERKPSGKRKSSLRVP